MLPVNELINVEQVATHQTGKLNLDSEERSLMGYHYDVIIDGKQENVTVGRNVTVRDSDGETIDAKVAFAGGVRLGDAVYDYDDVDVQWEIVEETTIGKNLANAQIGKDVSTKLNMTITLPEEGPTNTDGSWK